MPTTNKVYRNLTAQLQQAPTTTTTTATAIIPRPPQYTNHMIEVNNVKRRVLLSKTNTYLHKNWNEQTIGVKVFIYII